MKILRPPGIPTPFVAIHKPGCGATLEVLPADIQSVGYDRQGAYVRMHCAHCREEFLIASIALPDDWNARELGRAG